jgi:hypothetical protein
MVHMQVNTHAEVAIYGPVLAVLHMELHFFFGKSTPGILLIYMYQIW